MENDYININNLNANYLNEDFNEDEELEKNGILTYQFQAKQNKSFGNLIAVGKFMKRPSIMINQFQYNDKIKCIILTCLYDLKELITIKDGRINMIKMIINYENNNKLYPLCFISYTFTNKDINKYIDLLSSNKDIKNIDGKFSLEIYYENKILKLKEYNYHVGTNGMIEEIIKQLVDPSIQELLDRLIAKIDKN